MAAFLLALLMLWQFPRLGGVGGGVGAPALPDWSTLQGEVRTKEGELATISVRTRQDETRADQRGGGMGGLGRLRG